MKKVLLSSAIVAALIFTGCSSKDPSIDATKAQVLSKTVIITQIQKL